MAKIRVQIAPEIEFKMEVNIDDIDENSRDYDVQQHKAEVFAEFKRRLDSVFSEGYQMHGFEFGKDTGMHKVV